MVSAFLPSPSIWNARSWSLAVMPLLVHERLPMGRSKIVSYRRNFMDDISATIYLFFRINRRSILEFWRLKTPRHLEYQLRYNEILETNDDRYLPLHQSPDPKAFPKWCLSLWAIDVTELVERARRPHQKQSLCSCVASVTWSGSDIVKSQWTTDIAIWFSRLRLL